MLSLVVFAVAVGLATPRLQESAFTSKREYVYRYEAQTVTGVPGASKIYSGVKVIANCRVQFQSASVVIAQLEDIELYTMNDAIRTSDPTREQLDHVKMTRFYCPVIYKTLMDPFTFTYTNGHVFNLRTPEAEPYWSVNIKRGVVSLFEINLERRMTPYKTDRVPLKAYETFEMCPSGLCRTEYAVEEPDFNPEIPENTLMVTKTRDFTNCTLRADWVKTMFMTKMCAECENEKTLDLVEGTQVRYTLKGTRKNFVILSAIGESHVSFYPYTTERSRASTIINQTMYLLDAMDLQDAGLTARTANKVMVPRKIFVFVPEEIIESKFPFQEQTRMPIPTDEIRFARKQTIVNALRTAAESMTGPTVLKTATAFPVAAISFLRRANETVVKEIWNEFAYPKTTETKDDIIMRKVVWTCAAATGNYITGTLIVESCVAKKIPPSECVTLINIVARANEPNATFVEKLLTIAGEIGEGEEPQLVRALWLGIGVLTNKIVHAEKMELKELNTAINICTAMLPHEHNPIARREVTELKTYLLNRRQEVIKLYIDMRSRIAELVKSELTKAGVEPQIMALKTAGNAGIPELVPIFLDLIRAETRPEYVRFTAVYALHKMAEQRPEWIIAPLMEVFMKTTDTTAVRIACFNVIMMAMPPRSVVEMLARHVAREPDLHVASFMYSFFETVSNSTQPCWQTMAKEAAIAVHLAPKVKPGIQYSAFKGLDFYRVTPNIRAGLGAYFGYIGSNSSILPKAMSAHLHAHVFGRSASVFEVGMFTEGLGMAIDKLVGPKGVLTNRKSVLDLLSPRIRRSTSGNEKMEEITEKLNITPRKLPSPMGSLYLKLFGYELRYFDLEETIHRLATSGKISIAYEETEAGVHIPINFKELLYLGDANIIVPTEAGFPVSVHLAATAAVKVEGTCKAKVTPALFESRRQTSPVQATATFGMKPSAVMEVTAYMSTIAFKALAGAAVRMFTKINAPVEGTIIADLHKKKFVAEIKPPIQEEPIIEVEAFPETYQTITTGNNEKIIEITEGARIMEKTFEYGENTLGLKMCAVAKIPSPFGTHYATPSWPFTGRTSVQFFMKPGHNPPEKVKFQAQFAAGTPVKSTKGSSEAVSSCDCFMGRVTGCLWACEEQDPEDAETLEPIAVVEDYPDLVTKDISVAEIKTKLQTKLGSSMRLSPFGYKWGMIAVIDASSPEIPRKLQLEALWQSVNRDHIHQLVTRLARTALPTYPQPWEMLTHAMVQYPNRLIHPKMLLDPSYQIQINKDMQFMTRFMNHRPILAMLNQTAVTILHRHLQHLAGGIKPVVLMRTMFTQLFARTRDAEVRDLMPIWRTVITHYELVTKIRREALDPIFIIKNAGRIATKIAALEKLQLLIIQKIQALRQTPPTSLYYIPTLEYCLMEHYYVLTTLSDICFRASKMAIVPGAEALYTKTIEMITNLNEQVIQHAEILATVPPPPATTHMALKKVWPKIERLCGKQISVLVALKEKAKAPEFPSLQEVMEVVNVAKETIPILINALKNVEEYDSEMHLVPVLLKVANQHFMVYRSLHYLIDRISTTSSTNESQLSHVMQTLKNQVSAVAVTAAVLVKFEYEIATLEPVISKTDMAIVRTVQKLQLEIGLETMKISTIRMYNPYALSIELPEQLYGIVTDIVEFTKTVITKMQKIVHEVRTANIEPNVCIFEKVILTVFQIRTVVQDLHHYLKANTIMVGGEIGRTVELLSQCEEVLLTCETLELNVTTAFERIWLTASQPEVISSEPMSKHMVEAALSITVEKQREVKTELTHMSSNRHAAITSLVPSIETLIDTCRGIQGKIDWIQLWGVPLGPLAPLFTRCITEQQEILKMLRQVLTVAEEHIENPMPYNLAVDNLQSELARIVKIGSVVMPDKPMPYLKNIPEVPINPVTKLASGYLPLAVTAFCNISFGAPGSPLKTIVMKLYASKSFEQYMWESRQMSPLVRDESVDKAIIMSESTELPNIVQHPVYHLLNSLHHRHLVIKYNPTDIPEHVTFTMKKWKHMMTAYNFWNTFITYPVSRTPGVCHIMNEAKMGAPISDFFVMTPNETISMYGIHSYVMNALAVPIALTRPPIQRRLQLAPIVGPYIPTVCKAFYRDIRTFDGVEYNLPDIGSCPAVLAMDCSPAKTFAITVLSDTTDFSRKRLSIVAENKVFEVAATATGATMTVDGAAVTVTRSTPYILERPLSYGEAAVTVKITKDLLYRIELPILGIYISTDGNLVEIKASPVFKMKTCGLCSNMDGQQRYEFEAPDGRVFNTPEPFITSYIIKGPNCPARTLHNVGGPGRINNEAEDNCRIPLEETLIRSRKDPASSNRQVCFSTRPIKRCRDGCSGIRNESRKSVVVFRCLPDDRQAKQIRRQIRNGHAVNILNIKEGVEARLSVIERTRCRRR